MDHENLEAWEFEATKRKTKREGVNLVEFPADDDGLFGPAFDPPWAGVIPFVVGVWELGGEVPLGADGVTGAAGEGAAAADAVTGEAGAGAPWGDPAAGTNGPDPAPGTNGPVGTPRTNGPDGGAGADGPTWAATLHNIVR